MKIINPRLKGTVTCITFSDDKFINLWEKNVKNTFFFFNIVPTIYPLSARMKDNRFKRYKTRSFVYDRDYTGLDYYWTNGVRATQHADD